MDRPFPWGFAATEPVAVEALPLDVYEKDGNLVIKAGLPGVKQADVKVRIADDILTISAERHDEKEVKKEDYHLKEYAAGTWSRSLRLPPDVLADKAHARFTDGALTLTIPRSPAAKPRNIEVKVG
jgi:HSP20 family protein